MNGSGMRIVRGWAPALLIALPAFGQRIIYVNDDPPPYGHNDGTSWVHAYNDLQDALAEAAGLGGQPVEIRVAAGEYKPDDCIPGCVPTASFVVPTNTSLYGGFAGHELLRNRCLGGSLDGAACYSDRDCCDEYLDYLCCNGDTGCELGGICWDGRDIAGNETILSGDLQGNDDYDYPPQDDLANRTDNSLHVVTVPGSVTTTTVIDGFTIRSGNAHNDSDPNGDQNLGGAVFHLGRTLLLANCHVTQNIARHGGVYTRREGSNWQYVIARNCLFDDNYATRTGAALSMVRLSLSKPKRIRIDSVARGAADVANTTAPHSHVSSCMQERSRSTRMPRARSRWRVLRVCDSRAC